MQAALSLLLTKVRPDRLLIEPTGIGPVSYTHLRAHET